MINDYVREVHLALQNRKEKIILVNKSKLLKEDIKLINKLNKIYNKKVILGTLQEIIFNKDDDTYIVK